MKLRSAHFWKSYGLYPAKETVKRERKLMRKSDKILLPGGIVPHTKNSLNGGLRSHLPCPYQQFIYWFLSLLYNFLGKHVTTWLLQTGPICRPNENWVEFALLGGKSANKLFKCKYRIAILQFCNCTAEGGEERECMKCQHIYLHDLVAKHQLPFINGLEIQKYKMQNTETHLSPWPGC